MKKKLLAIMLASALVACGGKNDTTGKSTSDNKQAQTENKSTKVGELDVAVNEKLNNFIMLNNDFMKYWGPSEHDFSNYYEKQEAAIKQGEYTRIRSSRDAKNASEKLGKALEKTDVSLKDVDPAGQELKAVIDSYLPKWEELETYNKAKKYEDDNGAKGKELLTSYVEAQAKIKVAYDKFDVAVKATSAIEKEKRVAYYKKEGLMLELHKEESLDTAMAMLNLFEDEKDIKNPKKIEEANKLLAQLETTLDNLDKEYKAAKEANKIKGIDYTNSMHSNLVDLTASYREMRKGANIGKYNDMVKYYNKAVANNNGRIM